MGRLNLITRVRRKGKQEGQGQREEDIMMDTEIREERFADAMLLGLKVEGGYYPQNEEAEKDKKMDFSLELPERAELCSLTWF